MSDSTTNLDQIQTSQAAKEVVANELFDATSPAAFGGRRAAATLALTWGYYGGRWAGLPVANGTLSLAASTTNYIVAARATGVVTVSTATTDWDDTAQYAHLYMVGTDGTGIAWYEDHRAGNGGIVGNLAGAGLTRWAESIDTASPHDVRYLIALAATDAGATDIDAAIVPKGAGAFQLASGGGQRGQYAVDLQLKPDSGTGAAAEDSFVTGRGNSASGINSAMLGGYANTASGQFAVVVGGNGASATAAHAIAMGGGAVASAAYALAFAGGAANGAESVAVGRGASANGVFGLTAEAANFAPNRRTLTLYGPTSSASERTLTSDEGSAGTSNQMTLEVTNNNGLLVEGVVMARETGDSGAAKSWHFRAHLNKRITGGTALVAAVTPTVIADSGVAWSIAVTADDTNRALKVAVTGAAATNINWAASLRAQAVSGA